MASKLFISAKEVAKELEVSDSYAYRLIRQLNAELEQKGFVVVKGKIAQSVHDCQFFLCISLIDPKFSYFLTYCHRKTLLC